MVWIEVVSLESLLKETKKGLMLNIFTAELEENSTLNADIWETAGLFDNATFPLDKFSYNNSALRLHLIHMATKTLMT